MKYFISLVNKDIINLDFLNINEIDINDIEEIYDKLDDLKKNKLYLFKIV